MSQIDGDDSTLSDVFAFIETFDSSESESSLANVTSSEGDSSSVSSSDPAESTRTRSISTSTTTSKSNTKKKKPTQPGQVPQSTKFQREQRDQVLALRQQVLELTAQLEQMMRTRCQPTTMTAAIVQGPQKPKGFVSVWEAFAIVQCQERQRSEQTNRELKTMLARQRKLKQSICKLLGRKDALEGMELLCRLQPMPESVSLTSTPQLNIDPSDAILAQLEITAATLYMRTDSLFPLLKGQPMASFSTKDKFDDPLGTYIETTTTTPMACPLHVAAEISWKGTTKESQDPEKIPRFMRAKCHNTLARSCKLDMFNTLRIDGINFVRRYIDSDRIVLVSTSTWLLPAQGIHFQDNIWTIVCRSPVDPQNASFVQSFCQFGAQTSGVMPMPKEAFVSAQEYARGSIGTKLRHLQERQQRYLLEYGGSQTGVC